MSKKRNIAKEIYDAVVKYFGSKCNYCEEKKKLQLHHILPLSRGGINELGNIELVCKKCHDELHRQIRKVLPLKRLLMFNCLRCEKEVLRKIKVRNNYCLDCQEYNLKQRK